MIKQEGYFEQYIEILADGFKKVRKVGFKKMPVLKELLETIEGFLHKEVYGRIEPSNYLLVLLLFFGTKNNKFYPPLINTIQKLFSYNFISPSEDLSSAMRFVKEELKDLLILPHEDYTRKTFHEVYIQTLMSIPDRDQAMSLLICKNIGLIFRLTQNSIPRELLILIVEFIIEVILQNKLDDIDKALKSTLLEMIRHSVQSLKEVYDNKFLQEDETLPSKKQQKRYTQFEIDKNILKKKAEEAYDVKDYEIIPADPSKFQCLKLEQVNQNNEVCGKFGWCFICRKKADYYCRSYRIPVCSYRCKQQNLQQAQQAEKILKEEKSSFTLFEQHARLLCRIVIKYLSHQDIRKRSGFSQIFVHLSSELKKLSTRATSPEIRKELRNIFKQCAMNVIMQTEALQGCLVAIKKLLPLNIFVSEAEILFQHLSEKLVHFMTPANIKEEILRFSRDLIKNEIIFQNFMNIDCDFMKQDVIRNLIESIAEVYIGVKAPEGINIPGEDPGIKKLAFQILCLFERTLRNSTRILNQGERKEMRIQKEQKNRIKNAIQMFNKAEKPLKIVKRLIKEKFFEDQPQQIAQFIHKNSKKLSFTNIGILIGDIDQLGQSIRDHFIGRMKFSSESVDQGMRILLSHFTIPGESQVVERIIDSFSRIFYEQNIQNKIFSKYDAVYSFSYLLMMLQTNLHNPQVVEKMTLAQFSNLSKNMNGEGPDFPDQFLLKTYESIQRKQLGFHQKQKEIEVIQAYQQNLQKKAQQIHQKQLQSKARKEFNSMVQQDRNAKVDRLNIELIISQCYEFVLNAQAMKVSEFDEKEKEETLKYLQIMESMIKFGLHYNIESLVGKSMKKIWQQITNIGNAKKYLLIQKLLVWVREFHLHIYEQWNIVIYLFSMFDRSRLIKKDTSHKNSIMVMVGEKFFIYENYIKSIFTFSGSFNNKNLEKLVEALIQVNRQEIKENHHPFCLDKINDVFESNSMRLPEIFPLLWPKIKAYIVELGQNKVEKNAIFGTDFLKQQITRFFKRKDLLPFQREYLIALQEIFTTCVNFGVKEYIIAGILYFVNNHSINIKTGWRIILPILSYCFGDDQNPNIKESAHNVVKVIYESQFRVIDLEENYEDFVQILSRMAHEKEEIYQKSCLDAAITITNYYQKKMQMNLQDPSESPPIDINFWQTRWLPLLSRIYGICGDFRPQLQKNAITCLFGILKKYGRLFEYQFWKMILQGVLRPTFEEITYTSQSKQLQKKQLEEWLKNSFSLLFEAIAELIQTYFAQFQLFLTDIFKIYESCILSNSNKILVQLSMEALSDLLKNVGSQFQELNWTQYIEFIDNISKKTYPTEMESFDNWKKSRDLLENSYQNKCSAINLILLNIFTVLQQFNEKMTLQHIQSLEIFVKRIYGFCKKFNQDYTLRDKLWKNGFFTEMKNLPGLLNQEHESLKCLTFIKYKIMLKDEDKKTEFIEHILSIFSRYAESLIYEISQSNIIELEQKDRQATLLQVLILQMIIEQIQEIGLNKFIELGYKKSLFQALLGMYNKKVYSSKSEYEMNSEREKKFTETIKNLLTQLFSL